MNNKIFTAEEFIMDRYDFTDNDMERLKERMKELPMINFENIPDLMVAFAQYHVNLALQAAANNAKVEEYDAACASREVSEKASIPSGVYDDIVEVTVNKESILSAYPLDKIV